MFCSYVWKFPTCHDYHIEVAAWQACATTAWSEREMFYLTTHSTHFIYGYMASDIWLRTIRIVRKKTRCRHTGYSYRLTARVLLYAPSHRQDETYHGLCYTSRGALAGTREIAQWVHPMKDRSNDPSHHERTLYLWATSRSCLLWMCTLNIIELKDIKQSVWNSHTDRRHWNDVRLNRMY